MGGLGMPEIIVIMVIALIVFGPRKLPELGKSLGKAMNQFKRASEDFKRTWEDEVDLENTRKTVKDSTASNTSTTSTNYSTEHNSDYSSSEYSYDPYNTDYGYNAPSDENVAAAAGHNNDVANGATPHVEAPTTTPAPKKTTQAGQWI